jgi:hypothetical protein
MGDASARDGRTPVKPTNRKKWRKEQRRYQEILREIRSHLTRNGMYGVVRVLRRTSPEYLERCAIQKTREDADAIAKSVAKLSELLERATLAPEMQLRLEPEKDALLRGLRAVQEICEQADQNQPGADQVLIWCASIAFTLLFRFSDKMPTSGSAQSPYRVVASLLYEVLTGEHGHDLRRACDKHLKAMRSAR